jgi:hypothetical protein
MPTPAAAALARIAAVRAGLAAARPPGVTALVEGALRRGRLMRDPAGYRVLVLATKAQVGHRRRTVILLDAPEGLHWLTARYQDDHGTAPNPEHVFAAVEILRAGALQGPVRTRRLAPSRLQQGWAARP